MSVSRRRALLLAVALAIHAGRALAHDPERAAALFREGRAALNAGDYATACSRFAESESQDPRVGTLINLALCEEGRHKLAASHQYWQQATDFARATADARADYCAEQLARMEGRVPRLTIRLDGAAPPDTVVTRDGVDFGASSLGVPLPVEPGPHRVTARSAEHAERQFDVDVAEGQSLEIVVEPGPLEAAPPPAPSPDHAAPASPIAPTTLRTIAYVTAGVGVAALAVGTAFGIRAINAGSGTSGHCDGDVCDAVGAAARRDEQSAGTVATVALVSGATLVTAGAALRVLAPFPREKPYVQRNLGYVLGGAGLVAAGVGVVFGARALGSMNAASTGCTGNVCDHAGAADRRDAIASGTVSTIAFATGGALLASGILIWATAPRASSAPSGSITLGPTFAAHGAALGMEGAW